jgi:hypothetical protein
MVQLLVASRLDALLEFPELLNFARQNGDSNITGFAQLVENSVSFEAIPRTPA